MKRLLPLLLLLAPLVGHTQQLKIYCDHNGAVACTTASPGTAVSKWDPLWLQGGKNNANWAQWYGVTGLVKSNGPAAAPTAAVANDVFSMLTLPTVVSPPISMPVIPFSSANWGTATLVGEGAGANLVVGTNLVQGAIEANCFGRLTCGANGWGVGGGGTGMSGSENTATGWLALTQCTTCSFDTALGSGAMGFEIDGAGNTAVGEDSQRNTQHCNSCISVGSNSLRNGQSLSNSTAIGWDALKGVEAIPPATGATTGSNNTAVGWSAGVAYTTMNNSVLVGYGAGQSMLTGTDITAIGTQAMSVGTAPGTGDTAVGFQALNAASGDGFNAALGYQALTHLTTGSADTAVGNGAGAAITTGSNSTVVGTQAGAALTTAGFDTAVGWHALIADTSGGNTALGFGACASVTSATDDICIGSSADVYTATTSDELNINNTIRGGMHVLTSSQLSSCGTSPAISSTASDMAGTITTGSGATACTLTLLKSNSVAPTCLVTARSGTAPVYTTSDTSGTAKLTLTTAAASATYDYWCPVH